MKKIIASLCLSLFVTPVLVFAQTGGTIIPDKNTAVGGQIGTVGTMSNTPIDQTLNTIADYVVGVLIIMAVFYIIWAGYTFVTSAGDTEKVGEARSRIMYAGIGIVVALLAKGIVGLILSAMNP